MITLWALDIDNPLAQIKDPIPGRNGSDITGF
ncbi:hypothetical protein Bsel_0853 [[Bacillus] selenitireducens MLS10]|uniref:Uncharacterized protein n=1 Tax=Bacillus selenitireducens (strain ATCC 700615 / DSM 15326 / MLS10) TaxID=439292 RepID=D6XZK4_BACIE|nr:hypothetical protein Bsel_0853 [[Bacillus] selenitireducens MLS10]